ncbi:trypsin-like peptidase domain-containing protein [bacterium]|nr:trypsin-like peptidase domain-containing protein [bacterium]QQR57772.1 MAG: trypsin-like peptidase domain-containing protein [Candidatus Melainabacteria bacterium]
MKSKLASISIAIAMLLCQWGATPTAFGREISKAGEIFQNAKDGVVTVFSSTGWGSGFLADSSGLIVTNSHVVNEQSGHLRVKFRQNEVLEALILENDRENDIAILAVNLKNIGIYKSLPFFKPNGEELVVIGEKVIAIGSPIDRVNLHRMMTEGVVGKCDSQMIFHDAQINKGNSGGPLLNYDGEVIGINTIKVKGVDPGGAVPISLTIKLIEAAKQKQKEIGAPSPELLPDIPEIAFPISQFLRDRPEFFKNRKQSNYNFDSNYFFVSVLTPPQGYHQVMKEQDKVLKSRKARAKKKNFAVTDDEYDYKNDKAYNYKKPVVTVFVIPKPKLTTGTKILRSAGLATAATATVFTCGIAAPLMAVPFMYSKNEYKKDFLKLSLVSDDGESIKEPIESGRHPFEKNEVSLTEYSRKELVDKSYMGIYTFDAKEFDNDKKLSLQINIEGNDKKLKIKFPEKIKKLIVSDFSSYWDYERGQLAQKNLKINAQERVVSNEQELKE